MLHTFDDNGGFLRTRYCPWEQTVLDLNMRDMDRVLICFRRRFAEGDPYYKGKDMDTLVKMQLFYGAYDNIDSDIEWSCHLGYTEACVINLKDGTFEWTSYNSTT